MVEVQDEVQDDDIEEDLQEEVLADDIEEDLQDEVLLEVQVQEVDIKGIEAK
jgi:hypothetical protein